MNSPNQNLNAKKMPKQNLLTVVVQLIQLRERQKSVEKLQNFIYQKRENAELAEHKRQLAIEENKFDVMLTEILEETAKSHQNLKDEPVTKFAPFSDGINLCIPSVSIINVRKNKRFLNKKIILHSPADCIAVFCMLTNFNQKINIGAEKQLLGQESLRFESIYFDEEYSYWDLYTGPLGDVVTLPEMFHFFKSMHHA